ncbi:hypothetical protein CR513_17730, partial [Mucuna pruriens]
MKLSTREHILSKLTSKFLKAQEVMKFYANKNCQPHPFKLNDWIFKLSKQYYEPFKIIICVGDVAFELALPLGSQIHLIFHAFKLKPYNGDPAKVQVLVQWQGLYLEDSSWEILSELLADFPSLYLEDKVFVHRGRDDMNVITNEKELDATEGVEN